MTEELTNKIADITSTISAVILLLAILIGLLYFAIYMTKTDELRQKHIKTLNEHDKAVITDYKNTYWTLKKNGKPQQDK